MPAELARNEDRPPRLTPREREVLAHLRTGIGNKRIAHALGIGEWTVKLHLTRIYAKLGVRNRTQAVLVRL